MKDSLKNLLGMYPYFFDKKTTSNFYKSQSVTNQRFQDVYQSIFNIIESFKLDKRILIWKEQSERFEYTIRFVANFPHLKSVTLYKNDTVIYSNTYSYEDNVNTFNYSYTHSTLNDVVDIELAEIIPQDKFKAVVETYDEYLITKGWPENDTIQGNEFDHDESLDEIGALNNIPRKEYIKVHEDLYAATEPPYNDRLSEDDYHYMKRQLEYNLRLHNTPLPVLELWKMYGIDAVMENREKLLLKVFDLERHPNFIDENAPGDGWFSGTLEEDGSITEWTPQPWEHLDKFCDYDSSKNVYFFVNASTQIPVVNQNVIFYFLFLNSFGKKMTGDYLVDIVLNDETTIVTDCDTEYFTVTSDNLSSEDENIFTITGKTSTGEIIGTETIEITVRGCDNADFYVSPSGSDDNDGKTVSTPLKTLQKAVNKVNGDKNLIVLLSGDHEISEPVLINKPCTILGCNDPVLKNLTDNVFFTINPNVTLSLQDLTLFYQSNCVVDNVSFANDNGDNNVIHVLMNPVDHYLFTLTSSKDIIQKNESCTFTATLTNNNVGVSGETVIFYDGITLLDATYTTQGSTVNHDLETDHYSIVSGGAIIGSGNPMSDDFIQFRDGGIKLGSLTSYTRIVNDGGTSWIRVDGDTLYYQGGSTSLSSYDIDVSNIYIGYSHVVVYGNYYGSAVTDSDGVASVSYEGKGSGHLNIKADCMNLTKTYEVKDCIWVDKKASHNTKWWLTQANTEQTTETDGILINNPNESGYSLCWTYLTDSFPSTTSGRNSAVLCWDTPLEIEFDIISVSSTSNVSLQIHDGTTSANDTLANYGITGACHVKLVFDGSTIKSYIDNSTTPFVTKTFAVSTPIRFGFRVNAGQSIKYDNLNLCYL